MTTASVRSDGGNVRRQLTVPEAVERFLQSKRADLTDQTLESYKLRLRLFRRWCEDQDIGSIDQLDGWDLDSYRTKRRGDGIAPSTLQNELKTLRVFLEYCEQIEVAPVDLHEKVEVPSIDESDEVDDTELNEEQALALIQHYRNDPEHYATAEHVFLEIAWFTGARVGGIRGMDLRDVSIENNYLKFVHRPKTDTPLKQASDGERPVGIPTQTAEVIRYYIDNRRNNLHDKHGRAPLLTTLDGRPAISTLRVRSYMATFPCHYGPCPHEKDPATCEFKDRVHASKCPSSRSPHQIRTGSIGWQLNLGFPPEIVAERVNSSVATIERHYDQKTGLERLEQRRRQYVNKLDPFDQ